MYSCIFYATLRHKRCTAISTCTTSCSTKETRLSEKSSSFICSSSNFNIVTLFIIMAWPKEHRTHRKKGKENVRKKTTTTQKNERKSTTSTTMNWKNKKKLMQTVFVKPFELYRDKSNSQQPTTDNNNNGEKTRMFWVWNV